MKKTGKGDFAYYDRQKRKELIRTVALFALAAAIYIVGLVTTGDNKNLLTVVAILGVLPAARSASSAITRCMYQTISRDLYKQISPYSKRAYLLYNMVFTSRDKTVPADVVAVCGNTICGYTSHKKADPAFLEKHIRTILKGHKLKGQTIKIHRTEECFMNWLNSLPKKREKVTETEQEIRQILLQISL